MTCAAFEIPMLRAGDLRLRAPILADFEHRAAYYGSPRAVWEGGPRDRADAWRIFSSDVGCWALRGYGPFSVEAADGTYLGEVGLYHGEDFPEAEIGWFVVPEAEGRGIAARAARAVLDWLRDDLGRDHIVSYITPGNERSVALGLRLGGVIDPTLPGIDPDDIVIRHDLRGRA